MQMEECRHGNLAPRNLLVRLPESQGGLGRHKCPNCAFQLGVAELDEQLVNQGPIITCAHGNHAPEKILLALGESQGGSGRHKCVVCAYQEGRASARGLAQKDAWIPKKEDQKGSITQTSPPKSTSTELDPDWWIKEAERRKEIGDLGEALVLEYEKSLLISLDRPDLANRVTQVSKAEGDHVGYDIRSYRANGALKYIEVKATTSGIDSHFYISGNELKVARNNEEEYCIYRLFDLDEEKRTATFYVIEGGVAERLHLEPVSYQAYLKD